MSMKSIITSDMHMHTTFSHDSESTPEEMVQGAIKKGLKTICFTDHFDKDNWEWGPEDIFDPEVYFNTLIPLRDAYKEKLEIRIGIELGLRPELGEYYRKLVSAYPFDFVIGSAHSIQGEDPATGRIFKGQTDKTVYRLMFEEMLADIRNFSDYDTLGHLDYIVRYGTRREEAYSYQEFSDVIDTILKRLVEDGKGIELNMAGLKYGLPFAHPHPDVLKRFKELGGEMVTIGADGHCPEHIAYEFRKVGDMLRSCGFTYYTEFIQRKPVFRQVP